MGYPQHVEVDPAGLRVVAGAVETSAVTLKSATSSSLERLAPTGQDGWDAAAAARSAQSAWGTFLGQLSHSVSGLSRDISAAARSYTASDESAAARLAGRGGRVPE